MKKIIIVTLFLGSMICYSCKQEGSKHKMEKHDTSGPEFTSAYNCPMHCKGSGSDQPGKCPVCQMDYELNEEKK